MLQETTEYYVRMLRFDLLAYLPTHQNSVIFLIVCSLQRTVNEQSNIRIVLGVKEL